MKSSYTHCQWVQIFDKDLKRLIYLGYWGTKHWKCLASEKDAKANINSVELKFSEIQKQLFTYVLQNRCSLKFRNVHRKTPALKSFFNKLQG